LSADAPEFQPEAGKKKQDAGKEGEQARVAQKLVQYNTLMHMNDTQK
jgi:hypothetical protein